MLMTVENRATKFTENFNKHLNLIWENKPKDMPIMIYIYARDPKVRTDERPDWVVSIEKMCNTMKYDDWN